MVYYNSVQAIASRIQLEATHGTVSDDETTGGISLAAIIDMIMVERDFFIGQAKLNPYIQPEFYQTLCCLEIKCGNIICMGRNMPSVNYVEIPKPALTLMTKAIRSVIVGDTSYANKKYYKNERYTYDVQNASFIKEDNTTTNYVLILSEVPIGARFLCIEAVFYDAGTVYGACIDDEIEKPFAFPNEYLTHLERRVDSRLVKHKQMPRELSNDAK